MFQLQYLSHGNVYFSEQHMDQIVLLMIFQSLKPTPNSQQASKYNIILQPVHLFTFKSHQQFSILIRHTMKYDVSYMHLLSPQYRI